MSETFIGSRSLRCIRMKLRRNVTDWPLQDVNNYCITTGGELEIEQNKVYVTLMEVIQK